jgi:hypothetical protein
MNKVPAAFVSLIAVIILVALGWFVLAGDVADEYRLPVIAVFAIASMFAVIAFIAAVYQSANLAATTQALGLPEGSVRALIALSLIVIFAVITLFMLARLTAPQQVCKELMAALSLDSTKSPENQANQTTAPGSQSTKTTGGGTTGGGTTGGGTTGGGTTGGGTTGGGTTGGGTTGGGTTGGGTTGGGTTGGGTTGGGTTGGGTTGGSSNGGSASSSPAAQALDIIKARQAAAQDLAKQLLTMLGTLLAAVSSFYFGSSAASSANDPKKLADAAKTISTINKP